MPGTLLIRNVGFKVSDANLPTFLKLCDQSSSQPTKEAKYALRCEIEALALRHNQVEKKCRTMVAGITADGQFCSYNVDILKRYHSTWIPFTHQTFKYTKPDLDNTSPEIKEAEENAARFQHIISQLDLKFCTATTAQSIANNFAQPQNPHFKSNVEIHDHESHQSCKTCNSHPPSESPYGRITPNTLKNASVECLARLLKESTHQQTIATLPQTTQASKLQLPQKKVEYRVISTQTELVSPDFYNDCKKQTNSSALNPPNYSDIAVPTSATEGKDDSSLPLHVPSANLKKHPTIESVTLEGEKYISRESQTRLPKVDGKVYTNKTDLYFTYLNKNAAPILANPEKASALHANYLTCDFKDINTTALGEKCIMSLAYCYLPSRRSEVRGVVLLTPGINSPASKWNENFINYLINSGYSVLLIERRNEGFSQKTINKPYVSKHQNLDVRHKKDPNLPADAYCISQTYTIPEIGNDYFELMKSLGINHANPAIPLGYCQGAPEIICGLAKQIEVELKRPINEQNGLAISQLVLLSVSGVQKEIYSSCPNASANQFFTLIQPGAQGSHVHAFEANVPWCGVKRFWLPGSHPFIWLLRDGLSKLAYDLENKVCQNLSKDNAYALKQYLHPALPDREAGLSSTATTLQTRLDTSYIPAIGAITQSRNADDVVKAMKIIKSYCDAYDIPRSLLHGDQDILFAPDAFIGLEKAIGAERHQLDNMGHLAVGGGIGSDFGCLELFMIIDSVQKTLEEKN